MQPFEELKILIRNLYAREASGGHFDFARRLFSRQEGVLLVGSEPDDRHEGYEAIIRFYEKAGLSDLEIRIDDLKSFQDGGVGWVVDQVTVVLPKGIEVPVRHTYIFHREGREWKVVHAHISVGIPDESFGMGAS